MELNNICFIDFETTGISLIDDYPIEIGAVLTNCDLQVIHEFHSYIKPNNSYTLKNTALKIHGISTEFINKSPDEKNVLREMFEKLGTNYRLASWNMSFDVAFFKILCHRNSFDYYLNKINYRHIDVQTISYIAKEIGFIPSHINSLSNIVDFFGLKRSKNHSAKEDALLLVEVYKTLNKYLKVGKC